MVLQRVVYELFSFEAEMAGGQPARPYDELYRQVRLEGAGGERLYIAWDWGRGKPDYFLSFGDRDFCTAPAEVEGDVSAAPMWRDLVGKPVTVAYRDRSWQVIEVRADDAVVYCCSFQSDRVFVMRELRVPRLSRRG
jgi:hypothetical protein